jgi:hypothetical protein
MKKLLLDLTEPLVAAIDLARGKQSRAAFVEQLLWKSNAIKQTEVKQVDRPTHGGKRTQKISTKN